MRRCGVDPLPVDGLAELEWRRNDLAAGVSVSPLTAGVSLECDDFGTGGAKVSFARLVAIRG